MNLYIFTALLLFQSLCPNHATTFSDPTLDTEIVMKSKLNKDKNRLLVKLMLPAAEIIWFELYDRQGVIKHRWEERILEDGDHDIALPLPDLTPATYIVKLMTDDNEITQLLFLK